MSERPLNGFEWWEKPVLYQAFDLHPTFGWMGFMSGQSYTVSRLEYLPVNWFFTPGPGVPTL